MQSVRSKNLSIVLSNRWGHYVGGTCPKYANRQRRLGDTDATTTTPRTNTTITKIGEQQLLMKLRLEYVYSQILFTLTQQVQSILIQNPNYDLEEVLEASETTMRNMLHDTEGRHVGSYSCWGH
jgi:hypothetical protein